MTREIEARLKLSAIDRTATAFRNIGSRMTEIDRKAKAINAAAGKMAAVQAAAASRAVGLLAPAAVAAGAASSFKTFAEFDRKMTDIGVTADATKEQLGAATSAIYEISRASAMPVDQTVVGLDSLVAAGRKLPEAMAFLPSVVRTARAASAEVVDIARSADAMGESFRIAAGDMEKGFDVVTYLGKEGKFELKDQARYLPSIAPLAATRRLLGIDGLTRVGAALQVIRKNSGTAEEAASAMSDVLGKLDSDETIKKFMKKFDIDLPAALKKAKKEGKNTFDAFIEIAEKAIGGDTEKLNQIFADKEARRGLTALIQYRQEYFRLIEAAKNAPGTVRADESKKIDDAKASLDRLSNSWGRFVVNTGRSLAASGVPEFLDKMSDGMDRFARIAEERRKIAEAEKAAPGSGREMRIGRLVADGMSRADAEELVSRADTAAPDFLANPEGLPRPRPPTPAEDLAKKAVVAGDVEAARRAVESAKGGVTGLFGYRSQLGERNLRQAEERLRRAESAAMEVGWAGASRYAPVVDRARLAAGEARRYRPAPEVFPMPKPRPERGMETFPVPIPRPADGAAAATETMTGFREELARQQAAAEAEAQSFMGRLQAIFGQPVTVNVTVNKPPLDTGRSFAGGAFTGAP